MMAALMAAAGAVGFGEASRCEAAAEEGGKQWPEYSRAEVGRYWGWGIMVWGGGGGGSVLGFGGPF